MSQLKNPMEIFKLLNKSNCRQCYEATCLAFAASVFKGQKQLSECPYLDDEIIKKFSSNIKTGISIEEDMNKAMEELKSRMDEVDIALAAQRTGGKYLNGKVVIKIFGKDFAVDSKGNFFSDIHMFPWVTIPVLTYIIDGKGLAVSGKWVSFRELKNGKSRYQLFQQRCEKPLKRVADNYPDLFKNMIEIFNGKQVENHYQSDISLVLHPFPKVPILICYWKPEDELESTLNIFFDSTADDNLGIESIYALIGGLVMMFEKMALRHGFEEKI